MKRAWLVRHAESDGNAGNMTSSPWSIKLTEKGHQQAREFAEKMRGCLSEDAPSLFVTSPYHRTKATAAPLLEVFPHVPHEEWPVQEFTYLCLAKYKHTTQADRVAPRDEYWARNDPNYVDGEGAESLAQCFSRVKNMFARIRACASDGPIVIFTHGHFIRFVMWMLICTDPYTEEGMARLHCFNDDLQTPVGNLWRLPLLVDPAGEVYMGPLEPEGL
jgi:probable phosphoglycerate mutase